MSERNWTNDQKKAIDARGGSVLLSAAAGSGKTAVLVERIIRLMTDPTEPVAPEELLVVTFTNAAAAQMRERAAQAIDALIEKEPGNALYRSVRMQLCQAQISTIDSFAIKLVRENFSQADVEPDFTLLDAGEDAVLRGEAISQTLDEMCAQTPEIYDMLNSLTAYNRDDSELADKLLRLYDCSMSHPRPFDWLDSIQAQYEPATDVKDSLWGEIIVEYAMQTLSECELLLKKAINDVRGSDVFESKYTPALEENLSLILNARKVLEERCWDEIFALFSSFKLVRLPAAPRGCGDYREKLLAKARYDRCADIIKKQVELFCTDTQGFNEDNALLMPVITQMVNAVKSFAKTYDEEKRKRNSYNFTDIMHKALELLMTRGEDGSVCRSALAYEIGGRYSHILIDEYQDTNEAQDMLFTLLSPQEDNIFCVGDVKQSIYRFRLAMPEIFLKKSREYAEYDGDTFPARITLGMNFRSRKGILDAVNFLFTNIMSEYAGEMEYTRRDALYYGGLYGEDDAPCVEVHYTYGEEEAYVASLIKDILSSDLTVGGRRVSPGDICILMRSPSGKAERYEKALAAAGIDCSSPKSSSLFDSFEVRLLTSFLKSVNNPTDDVALLSVMMSPVYGFTPDDVAKMRMLLPDRKSRLYACLKACGSDKALRLLADLKRYSDLAAVSATDDFVRSVIELTGMSAIASAMKNGAVRRMNLMKIFTLSQKYAEHSGRGLSGFLRYLDKLRSSPEQISATSQGVNEGDSVKIMSIHKSKGLEFPVVILADCSKAFNKQELYSDMIVSSLAGVGMCVINSEKLQKYPTIGSTAAKIAALRASASEEMRLLYVAMTRASERLFMICRSEDAEAELEKASQGVDFDGKLCAGAAVNAKSYAEWIGAGFLSHPDFVAAHDCGIARKSAQSRVCVTLNAYAETQVSEEETLEGETDADLLESVRAAADYVYPYSYPKDARPKRTASDFEKRSFSPEYFAVSKPDFMHEGRLGAAARGTANHLLLQNISLEATSARSETLRLVNAGVLSRRQADAIRLRDIQAFIDSDFFGRIKNADKVYREKEFIVPLRLGDIDASAQPNVADESVLVLGKADLIFVEGGEAVVVDYKTDRSKTREQFIEAYAGQLDIYARAARRLLGMPVKQRCIYSLALGQAIVIE